MIVGTERTHSLSPANSFYFGDLPEDNQNALEISSSWDVSPAARQLATAAPVPSYVTRVATTRTNPASANFRSSDDELAPILRGICNIAAFNPCVPEAECVPTVPVIGEATCVCPPGYAGDGLAAGEGCVDINECATGSHDCDTRTTVCIDLPGSYKCECKPGFLTAPNGRTCLDIDECQNPALNDCHSLTMTCHNLEGTYRCVCKDPQQFMDPLMKWCRDLNECEDMDGVMNPCEQLCFDRIGGFECGCREGYKLARDGVSCTDVDECADPTLNACDPEGIVSRCQNEVGGYRCLCNIALGFTDSPDGISCVNLDECARDPYICGGALSCCKDMFPPQRFACTVPLDDTLGHTAPLGGVTTQNINNAFGASPLTSWIPGFLGVANSASLATPRVLEQTSTESPSGESDSLIGSGLSSPTHNIIRSDAQMGTRAEFIELGTDGIAVFQENGESMNFFGVIAGPRTTEEVHRQLDILRSLGSTDTTLKPAESQALRSLQLLTALKPGSPHIPGSQLGPIGGLRIARGATCPAGFRLGGDLYREKVRNKVKNTFEYLITSNIQTNTDGTRKVVAPQEVAAGVLGNTHLVADEAMKWYNELSNIPSSLGSTVQVGNAAANAARDAALEQLMGGGV
ncbi:fibrillin 1, related [Neospora caninum Liverpool]|uniref:Fibrillin 1, related n=1 Tax=Neospora caninum (strain Liverpool) TaxID=572307 RepID=F0VAE3_NEOCL|nr:fibrillin 1, related [Neospora caninum Liverpool]CBZ50632.1 fibrillin 1, related [Neospora caninum Liverpool]CEL65244.1 TPA: Fibrillin 1, related [Neospora caninum Liverpool]|eukprot:XP_003880665.1 fibrillin 1, related [Neospora caninum Liverpool]